MKKLICVLAIIFLCSSHAYAAGWVVGEPLGSRTVSDIDTYISTNNTALDLVLSNYRRGVAITYLSAATLTVGAGEIVCSNSDGTIRLMAQNTSATTVTWADIDDGAEATSTAYYVYAIMSAITDTTFTVKISASASAPVGITYYKRLGSFYNNASGNITLINNDDDINEIGTPVSKTVAVAYQATTDGYFIGLLIGLNGTDSSSYIIGYTDGASSPTTPLGYASVGRVSSYSGYTTYDSFCIPVKKGDYYKGSVIGSTSTTDFYFVPKQ